jgi:hypothetical protein
MAGKKYSDIFKLSNTENVADTDLFAIERTNGNTYILRANSIYNYISGKLTNPNVLSIGNTTVNTQINSTTITVASINANGSIGNPGDFLASDGSNVYWVSIPAGSFSNGISYTWSSVQTFNSNIVISEAATLSIGNSTVNVSINSTAFDSVSIDGGDF